MFQPKGQMILDVLLNQSIIGPRGPRKSGTAFEPYDPYIMSNAYPLAAGLAWDSDGRRLL